MSDYRPRLSVNIPQELFFRYQAILTWGDRSKVMIKILDQVVTYLETEGWSGVAKIMNGKVKLMEVNEDDGK